MSIPHKCPVCEGRGEVGKRLAQVGAILISEKPQRFRCHGCVGTGIVWDQTFQITPQPFPVQPFPGPTWISNGNPKLQPNADGVLTPVVPLTSIGDGVTKCVCGEPHYMAPAADCTDHTRDGGCSV